MRHRTRRSFVERLEDRNLLTGMPFGALPDDTAEYMLGDVYVNVVLMESDSSMAPFDVSTEDWTASEKADVKTRITDGLKWWEDTLNQIQDQVPDNQGRHGLLKFTEDWTHLNTPVHTGYEPITRTSQEFANWVYDFLGNVGFNQTGNFLTDLRAYNNAQRIAHNSNWSFTIFVVDDSHDMATDFDDFHDGAGRFAPGSAFSRSFAYAGGNAFVMPADRPASIVAHETGHMFWALDEYNTGSTAYQLTRGYYNTQNSNSSTNPASGFVQADSIMASGTKVDAAYAAHTSSTPSLEMIGWKDSDGDGIFDVLDVPFSLSGTGKYNSDSATFKFVGKSQVRTFTNLNPSGLKDDITINQIDRAEYKIDNGNWTTIGPEYHKYSTDLSLEIPVTVGASQIRIRTFDERTGVRSVEYVANLSNQKPQSPSQPGIGGYVFSDNDGSGTWQDLESGLAGWTVHLVTSAGQPLDLHKRIEPDSYTYGALLNNVAAPAVTLSAVGGDVADGNVNARNSSSVPSAGKVFFNNSITDSQTVDTWNGSRQLRIDFTPGVSEVNIKAISSGSPSVGRLEIYNGAGVLLGRYTTGVLSSGKSEVMKMVRPQGDIAYALAFGHAGTQVVLDTLEWGATSSTITDQFGYYNLAEISSGLYRVAVVPKLYYTQSFPSTPYHLIDVPDAVAGMSQLNFGFIPQLGPWRNPVNALDVNNDTFVTAIDALAGINYINTHDATLPLPPTRPDWEKYYDVNNDGYVSAVDILQVINELNRPKSPPPTGEGGGGSIGGGGLGGSPGGEAETSTKPLVPGPNLATQYYSQNPLQVLQVPGSAGCTCAQCTAITEVATGRVTAASTAKANVIVPLAAKPLELQSFAAMKKESHLQTIGKVAVPHIDGKLLHTIASAAPVKPMVALRRGRK
ncbi:MAG: hypothetical protein K8R36_23650 [Planctomycetales bacterium]|nr:hypothetical protein [Planctomycetales bacterium]